MNRRSVNLVAAIAAASLLAAACGGDDDAAEPASEDTTPESTPDDGSAPVDDTTAPDEEPADDEPADDEPADEEPAAEPADAAGDVCTEERVGGELSISPLSLATSLDPLGVGGGTSATGLEYIAIYDSLLRFDETTGEFVGQLAEGIEPNEDASVWTLTLREGVTFGNGDPFDADAVKAATDRYLTDEGSRMRSVAQFVQSVDVIDPLTVQYTLTSPWGFFPLHLSAGGGTVGALGLIPNVALIDEVGVDAFGQDNTGGGAGPYEIAEWSPPQTVTVRAKDDWWGGPVCIDEITFTPLPSGQAKLDSLRTGELDMAYIYRDPVVAVDATAEFDYTSSLFQSGNMVEFNMTNAELGDLRTRQAIAAAIDPEVINQRAFGGEGIAWSGLVAPNSDLLEATEGPQYDPELAAGLVEELKAEGMTLAFELVAGDPAANQEAALAIEAMLEAAGFDITLEIVPTQEVIARVYSSRDFEIALGGQVGSEATLFASLSRFNSQNPINPYGYAEPAFDEALDALQKAQTPDELQAAVDQTQSVWNETIPAHAYATDTALMVRLDGIEGLEYTRGVTPFFDTAYLDR